MAETLGTTSDLQLIIPEAGDTDWATSIRDDCFQKIVDHTHSGTGGAGVKLTGTTAITADTVDGTVVRLDNDQSLRGRNNADSANINILKVDTNDEINIQTVVSALKMKNDTYITARNNADSGDINIIKVNTSDTIDVAVATAITGTLSTTDNITIDNQKELRLSEADGNGSNYLGFRAPSALTTDTTFTFPDGDGTSGQVLTTNGSGTLAWSAVTPTNVATTAKTTTYTITTSDQTVTADATCGAFTLTLPAASGNSGQRFRIVKIDSSDNAVTIDGNGCETIDGATTIDLDRQYQSVYIECNGTEWFTVSGRHQLDSVVRLHTANGVGSTNTKIRRYTTAVTDVGSAITYADSATAGASFTINEDGVYLIEMHDNISSANHFGISLNSSQLTTDLTTITAADRLSVASQTAAETQSCCVCLELNKDDVIRPHLGSATGPDNNAKVGFCIAKIGRL